jgi:hypothetical protein
MEYIVAGLTINVVAISEIDVPLKYKSTTR